MASIKDMLQANTADILEATELLKVLGDREGQYVWKQLTAEGGDFVAFVTADDENSYPNCGVENGYYYELFEEGIKVTIDGEEYKEDLTLKSLKQNIDLGTPSHDVYKGCAVVLNNEIHTLGSSTSSDSNKHYKWDGSSWKSVSTLPYNLCQGCAVVLNNEIHIMGTNKGSSSNYTLHYKWNGSSWTKVSTLPYDFYQGCAVVTNNEIHILGSGAYKKCTNHYKWDGSSWTEVSTLPKNFVDGCAVVLNNEIIIVTANTLSTSYKWNGSSWVQFAENYTYTGCSAFVLNNEVYLVQGTEVRKYTGSYPWEVVTTLPYSFKYGAAVVMDNRIYVFCASEFHNVYQTIYY